jgi:putative methionine-R-sulfoxide reductase with GAF domain
MFGSPQSDEPLFSQPPANPLAGSNPPVHPTTGDSEQRSALEEPELEAVLQLLVERAQYITGATGTALALPQGDEMVCRASAGRCAPAVGARLQVRSGLTGESISRRQLLRCDNAEADPRVNLEACRALGIASIVVLPLLRRDGEVRGLFELFSDHPYAFEERDLIALERMADLTLTALDLAEQRHGAVPPAPPPKAAEAKPLEKLTARETESVVSEVPKPVESIIQPPPQSLEASLPVEASLRESSIADPPTVSDERLSAATHDSPSASKEPVIESSAVQAPIPEAMRRVQKCGSCGFPVSEGRSFCIDCERLNREKLSSEKKWNERKRLEKQQSESQQLSSTSGEPEAESASSPITPDEVLPPFLANASPVEESWLANHVNLLAVLVLIVGILVAIVVFR